MGQPTIANWLSEFGHYTTYAVGQWHLGYANERLLPLHNGFDHFYGFYLDAIDYRSKQSVHYDAVYDFWSDGQPQYDDIGGNDYDHDDDHGETSNSEINALTLFSRKMTLWLEAEGAKRRTAVEQQTRPQPFYLYAGLPSMHGPFSDDDEERNYCSLLLRTDAVIGEMVESLRVNDL